MNNPAKRCPTLDTATLLPDRHIALSIPLAQHDLPELQPARPECARRHQQVELPHPVKPLAVSLFVQGAIAGIEVLPPRHQCPVVVQAEIMPVLYDPEVFHRHRELEHGRYHTARE